MSLGRTRKRVWFWKDERVISVVFQLGAERRSESACLDHVSVLDNNVFEVSLPLASTALVFFRSLGVLKPLALRFRVQNYGASAQFYCVDKILFKKNHFFSRFS